MVRLTMAQGPSSRIVAHLAARHRVFTVADRLGAPEGWEPLDALVEIALGVPPTTVNLETGRPYTPEELLNSVARPDLEMRLSAAKELAQYLAPKLKAIEHSGPEGGPVEVKSGLIEQILQNMTAAKQP